MTTSDQATDQANDAVLDEYWAMYLRAEEEQNKIGKDAEPLQRDHQLRTHDLNELHRKKNEIEQDIRAQESMIRTVAASLGSMTALAEQARRKAQVHKATVARLVEETGRPHPKARFEEANRRAIAEQLQQVPPYASGQVPANPPAAAPPAPEEPPAADSTPSGPFSRFRSAHAANGSKP